MQETAMFTATLTRRRALALADTLAVAPPMRAVTITLAPGVTLPPSSSESGYLQQALDEMERFHIPQMLSDDDGAIIFWGEHLKLIALPPFPPLASDIQDGIAADVLADALNRSPTYGVVALRLGRYSVGVFEGRRLAASKTDTRYVKGRHSAGGTSQKRYTRIREKQIQQLYNKVCAVIADKWAPHVDQFERVFLAGERHTLNGLRKSCPQLHRLQPLTASRLLPVGEPNLKAMKALAHEVWKSRIIAIQLPDSFPFEFPNAA